MSYEELGNYPTNISFFDTNVTDSNEELLRITKDGFYVRGVKLEQDENEARALFEALSEWVFTSQKTLNEKTNE